MPDALLKRRGKMGAVIAVDNNSLLVLYEALNRACFAGALETATWTVRFAPELNAKAGDCDSRRRRIRIAPYLLRHYGSEAVRDTLLHEMTHQWEMERFGRSGHGKRFWMKLNAMPLYQRGQKRAPVNPDLARRRERRTRLIYQCPRCRVEVSRYRRGLWSCARCDRRFNAELVLRLVRALPPEPTDC
ncbi:MAG: SprT family zinc-dependent metalloprotease [Dehalococcoidia bacterium]